jgi:hypothetical protein
LKQNYKIFSKKQLDKDGKEKERLQNSKIKFKRELKAKLNKNKNPKNISNCLMIDKKRFNQKNFINTMIKY